MALSLRVPNLVTRSVVRSYTAMPKHVCYNPSWLKILAPKIPSMSVFMKITSEEKSFGLSTPDMDDFDTHTGLNVFHQMPGLEKEDMLAGGENKTLLIQGKTHNKDLMLDLISSPNKDEIMANIIANALASFRDVITVRGWAYYDMFSDRSILGKVFCPVIAMPSPINSFSFLKEETAKELDIILDMPGRAKMKLTTQGLRVFLNMKCLEREDVKVFFDYSTFFIEGKRKTSHYITGIHLPEGVRIKNHMIRRVMKDGKFYAFIPCCVKKEDRSKIQDQLNQ